MPKDETFWLSEWGGLCFFSHGDDKSRGVTILIRPGFPIDVEQVQSSENGRFSVLKGEDIGAVTYIRVHIRPE